MTVRLHSRLLDTARMATLAAALLAPFPAAAAPAGQQAGTVADVISAEAREVAYDTLWENLRLAVRDQRAAGAAPWADLAAERADDAAAVYLMSFYGDGTFLTGSGTIIRGSDGQGRVLTAGHVTPLEVRSGGEVAGLTQILAFGGDGRVMASLYPKATGYDGLHAPDIDGVTPLDVASDIAVLEVDYFAAPGLEAEWLDAAVGVAAEQPGAIMAIAPGAGSAITNPGISGASLRNAEGDVVGIVSYSYHPEDAAIATSGSTYLERVSTGLAEGDDPMHVAATVRDLLGTVSEPKRIARRQGGVGMGTPVVQSEILAALRSGPVRVGGGSESFHARLSGFPDHEMRSAGVIATELAAHPAPRYLDPDTSAVYEWSPLAVALDPIVIDAEAAF